MILEHLRVVDVVYLEFSEASSERLTEELKCGLHERAMRGIENWVNSWALRVGICGTKSSWKPVISNVSHWLILDPIPSLEVFVFFSWPAGNTLIQPKEMFLFFFCCKSTLLAYVDHGDKQPHAPINAEGHSAGKQLGRERPGSADGIQIEHEPAMCPCSKKSYFIVGMH